jgi:hypothetical protein
VYLEQAPFLLPLALLLFVPFGLLDAIGERFSELEADELSWPELGGLVAGLFAQFATTMAGDVFYAGVAMARVSESIEGRPPPGLGALARELPYGRLIAVDVLFSLGLALGLVLLIVPGVVFFVRYVMAASVLETEHLRVRQGFRRSRELARGHSGSVLVLVGGLYLLTSGLTSVLQSGGLWTLGESFLSDWMIAVAIGVVVTPVWAVGVNVVTLRLIHRERQSPPPRALASLRSGSPRP